MIIRAYHGCRWRADTRERGLTPYALKVLDRMSGQEEIGEQRMNGINTNGNGLRLTAATGDKPGTAGGTDAQTRATDRGQGGPAAASVCQHCDGTGWTPHGTKGLTKCRGVGFPHD